MKKVILAAMLLMSTQAFSTEIQTENMPTREGSKKRTILTPEEAKETNHSINKEFFPPIELWFEISIPKEACDKYENLFVTLRAWPEGSFIEDAQRSFREPIWFSDNAHMGNKKNVVQSFDFQGEAPSEVKIPFLDDGNEGGCFADTEGKVQFNSNRGIYELCKSFHLYFNSSNCTDFATTQDVFLEVILNTSENFDKLPLFTKAYPYWDFFEKKLSVKYYGQTKTVGRGIYFHLPLSSHEK